MKHNKNFIKEPSTSAFTPEWYENVVGRLYYARIAMNDKRINEILDEIDSSYRLRTQELL